MAHAYTIDGAFQGASVLDSNGDVTESCIISFYCTGHLVGVRTILPSRMV